MVRYCHAAMRRSHRSATKHAAPRASRSLLVSQEQAGITALSCLRMVLKADHPAQPEPAMARSGVARRANGQLFAVCGGLLERAWSACSGRSLAESTLLAQRVLPFFSRRSISSPGVEIIIAPPPLLLLHLAPSCSIYYTLKGQFSHAWRGPRSCMTLKILRVLCGSCLGELPSQSRWEAALLRRPRPLPRCLARILSACYGQA